MRRTTGDSDWPLTGPGNFLTQRFSNAPSDVDFINYYENMLNLPEVNELNPDDYGSITCIPVLDDPRTTREVEIRRLKPQKPCGPNGITPKRFRILPIKWLPHSQPFLT